MHNHRSLLVAALICAACLAGCVQVVGPGSSGSLGPGGIPAGTDVTPSGPGVTPAGPGVTPGGPGVTPAAPGGAFIAFVRDNDVWVVTADGSRSVQLTSDGAAGAYTDPTVAPDGTIYVLRDHDQLYHSDVTGRVIGSPVPVAVLENGAEGLTVAPDGAHLAFVTTGSGTYVDPRFGNPTGSFIYGGTDVIGPDGTSVPGAALGSLIYPSWSGPSTLVLTDGVSVFVDTLTSEPTTWLSVTDGCVIPSDCPSGQEPMANFARPAVNRTGTILAYEYQPYFGTAGRRMATINAPPPAQPALRCLIEGQENYSDPGSFSADGSLFAFDDTKFDPDTFETTAGQGVYVMSVDLNAPDCGASSARLVAPGGFQPDSSASNR